MSHWLARAALWLVAVGFMSLGAALIHSAFTGYRQGASFAFLGSVFLLTGGAVWWHKLRWV